MGKGSFASFLVHLHPRAVPEPAAKIRFTYCLGGLALWMFVLEIVTGLLLALHYVPSSGGAYESIQTITHAAPYGFFIRNLHYWCGQAMVAFVALHMVRVFVTGSFEPPRNFNWVIGAILLAFTLLVDFTGYLLVWDDRGLWAWTIARNLAQTVPIVGSGLATMLFGPSEVTEIVVLRLYVWHVILLPLAMTLLVAWHFWRIRKDGGVSGPL
ncbi:MAG: cytochrome b N-terminal domain-containing protein [Thermodesulfobacteriota bacterium]